MAKVVLYANFIPLLSLLFLFIFATVNPLLNDKDKKVFLFAIIINVIAILAVAIDYSYMLTTTSYSSYTYIIRRICSFINFGTSPFIPLLLISIFWQKKICWYYYLPLVVNFILCFLSMFYQLVFFISIFNTYDRGVFFILPFAVSLFYLLFLVFSPMPAQKYAKKNERFCLIGIIILLFLSIFLEIYLALSFLMWTSTALGLVFYYMVLLVNRFITDPLTDIYNRNYYSHVLSKISNHSEMIITAIDINGLKKVNDENGHKAGDSLLINATIIISNHTCKYSEFFRIGGDEFMLFTKPCYEKAFKAALDAAYIEAKSKNISFAAGTVYYKANQNLTEVLQSADDEMYKNKKIIKESIDYNMG